MNERRLFAIVLAAGQASRFGSAKQLHPVDDVPMVRHAVTLAEEVCGPRTVVVAGHEAADVVAACAPQQGFVSINSEYALGLSSSIACGIRSVAHGADGAIFLLADQPRVSAAHLKMLITAWRSQADRVVISAYSGTIGPPVIFPRADFARLLQLEGDVGARSVAESAGDRLISVACDAAAIDVDRPEDLGSLNGNY